MQLARTLTWPSAKLRSGQGDQSRDAVEEPRHFKASGSRCPARRAENVRGFASRSGLPFCGVQRSRATNRKFLLPLLPDCVLPESMFRSPLTSVARPQLNLAASAGLFVNGCSESSCAAGCDSNTAPTIIPVSRKVIGCNGAIAQSPLDGRAGQGTRPNLQFPAFNNAP